MDQESDDFLETLDSIDQHFYLGGILEANDLALISRYQITAIISILSQNTKITKHPNIKYSRFSIDDLATSDILSIIPKALVFIKTEIELGGNVLLHCAAGISRSASVAVAYFMVVYEMPYELALEKVRNSRNCVCPNLGFERQLRNMDIKALQEFIRG